MLFGAPIGCGAGFSYVMQEHQGGDLHGRKSRRSEPRMATNAAPRPQ